MRRIITVVLVSSGAALAILAGTATASAAPEDAPRQLPGINSLDIGQIPCDLAIPLDPTGVVSTLCTGTGTGTGTGT